MPRLDIRLARMANGFVTARIAGFPFLVITTMGAKTGLTRTQPLMYVRDGLDFVVLGTNFGQPKHPGWTANLLHHPAAVVEVGLRRLVDMYPGFDDHMRRRGSPRAPMFRLSPVPMTTDTGRP